MNIAELKRMGACGQAQEWFTKKFGESADTRTVLLAAIRKGEPGWVSFYFGETEVSDEQRIATLRVIANETKKHVIGFSKEDATTIRAALTEISKVGTLDYEPTPITSMYAEGVRGRRLDAFRSVFSGADASSTPAYLAFCVSDLAARSFKKRFGAAKRIMRKIVKAAYPVAQERLATTTATVVTMQKKRRTA
jgi:hypothetical protein